jgi:hypothetical protein
VVDEAAAVHRPPLLTGADDTWIQSKHAVSSRGVEAALLSIWTIWTVDHLRCGIVSPTQLSWVCAIAKV